MEYNLLILQEILYQNSYRIFLHLNIQDRNILHHY
nr:MAG TPA: hypothetical protein [Caudoviricetes sp.]